MKKNVLMPTQHPWLVFYWCDSLIVTDHGLQVPPMGNGAQHRTSPISLANIFGRDIVAQVGLPKTVN